MRAIFIDDINDLSNEELLHFKQIIEDSRRRRTNRRRTMDVISDINAKQYQFPMLYLDVDRDTGYPSTEYPEGLDPDTVGQDEADKHRRSTTQHSDMIKLRFSRLYEKLVNRIEEELGEIAG